MTNNVTENYLELRIKEASYNDHVLSGALNEELFSTKILSHLKNTSEKHVNALRTAWVHNRLSNYFLHDE